MLIMASKSSLNLSGVLNSGGTVTIDLSKKRKAMGFNHKAFDYVR